MAAGSDVPRPRRDGNPPINTHAGLGKVYTSAWPDRRDLDGDLAERDRAEKVSRYATDPHRPLDRLIDHMSEKGNRRSTVLGLAVPWTLSGTGRLVTSVSTGPVIGRRCRGWMQAAARSPRADTAIYFASILT